MLEDQINRNALCEFFCGFDEAEEHIACLLGHEPAIESGYCLKECTDYMPSESEAAGKFRQQEIIELMANGEVRSVDEISKILRERQKYRRMRKEDS